VEANGSSKFQAPKEWPHACSIKMDSFEPNAAVSGSYKKCYLTRTNIWSPHQKRKRKEDKKNELKNSSHHSSLRRDQKKKKAKVNTLAKF
jgi:hypothetical protein